MKKVIANCFSVFFFVLILFAALYDRTPIDPMYVVFTFGLGWCVGGYWSLIMTKKP